MAFDPKDPEAIAAIEAAVEAAVKPLVAKRDELLGEVKKLRRSAEITPEQLAAVEAERDEIAGKLAEAQKQAKTATKAAEDATKALANESGFTQRLLIDNGLQSALVEHGVKNPAHLKAAQALLRQGVQIVADGENRIAKVGDKLLGDFVKEWAAGDEGKHFVSAPANGGGGAGGGAGGAQHQGKTMTRAEFGALAPAAQMQFVRVDKGTVIDA